LYEQDIFEIMRIGISILTMNFPSSQNSNLYISPFFWLSTFRTSSQIRDADIQKSCPMEKKINQQIWIILLKKKFLLPLKVEYQTLHILQLLFVEYNLRKVITESFLSATEILELWVFLVRSVETRLTFKLHPNLTRFRSFKLYDFTLWFETSIPIRWNEIWMSVFTKDWYENFWQVIFRTLTCKFWQVISRTLIWKFWQVISRTLHSHSLCDSFDEWTSNTENLIFVHARHFFAWNFLAIMSKMQGMCDLDVT